MKCEGCLKKSDFRSIRKEEELLHAIRAGSIGIVRALIYDNVDIDYEDGSPLYLACLTGNASIADLLIEEHADIELGDYHALKLVIRSENFLILDRMINYFDSVIINDLGLPNRPLRKLAHDYAKQMGKHDVVEHLDLETISKNDIVKILKSEGKEI